MFWLASAVKTLWLANFYCHCYTGSCFGDCLRAGLTICCIHISPQMATRRTNSTPSKEDFERLIATGDRFELLKSLAPRVPLGTLRIADVAKVNPANPLRFTFRTEVWDRQVAAAEGPRCGGTFFVSFNDKKLE